MIATISTLSEWHGYTHACVRAWARASRFITQRRGFFTQAKVVPPYSGRDSPAPRDTPGGERDYPTRKDPEG